MSIFVNLNNFAIMGVPEQVLVGREICGLTGSQIAGHLGLSISNTIAKLRLRMDEDKRLKKKISGIISQYRT